MSLTVVACETTTKADWLRDRDGNVCATFVWVLMRHAPALISPDPPAQLCYYAHPPNRPTCGKCFSLMMPRKISNLYAGFTNCTRTAFSSTSYSPSTLLSSRWLPVDHIETLCTYLSFISFVVSFWATWSHKIEININANSEQQVDFPLSGNAPICRG